jgi:hypothetical protein
MTSDLLFSALRITLSFSLIEDIVVAVKGDRGYPYSDPIPELYLLICKFIGLIVD